MSLQAYLDRFSEGWRAPAFAALIAMLAGLPGVTLPLPADAHAENIYWVYALVVDQLPAALAARRQGDEYYAEVVMRELAARGVGTRPFFTGMHEQPVLRKLGFFAGVACPVAERIARQGLYIPSGLALTDAEVDQVAATVQALFAGA